MICRFVCQLSSGLGSSFQTRSLWICSIRRAIRQSSHRLSPSSNSQACPSGISARRFLRQLGQKMNTGIMALPVFMMLFVGVEFALRRRSQSLFDAPPAMDSIGEGVRVHSEAPSPLSNCQCQSFVNKVVGCALVVVLLLRRFPTAIAFFVVAIIVSPSYRGSFEWSRPHILKEVLEGLQPAVANSNAAVAVVSEPRVIRIAASCLHILPATVLRRLAIGSVGCVSMSSVSAPCAARLGSTIAECDTHDDQFSAALTSAVPIRTTVRLKRFASVAKNSELSVDVPSFIFHSWINSQRTTLATAFAAEYTPRTVAPLAATARNACESL